MFKIVKQKTPKKIKLGTERTQNATKALKLKIISARVVKIKYNICGKISRGRKS